jgi:hypothetical protein
MRYLYVKYQSPIPYGLKYIVQSSRSQGQKSWYQKNGLFMRYLYVKYQNLISNNSKDIAQVQVFSLTPYMAEKIICLGIDQQHILDAFSLNCLSSLPLAEHIFC